MTNNNDFVTIILSGGTGSRLYPSNIVNKHLLNIYDKPLIYYPLSLSIEAKINNIIFVSDDLTNAILRKRFRDGSSMGLKIKYVNQKKPNGIAEAFLLCRKLINNKKILLLLGDNILIGNNISNFIKDFIETPKGCSIMTYRVKNPSQFGILKYKNKKLIGIEEKPTNPKNDRAVIGIYFFNQKVLKYSKNLQKSKRGELEITSVIQNYIDDDDIDAKNLSINFRWFDTGETNKLIEASNYIKKKQHEKNEIIPCIEYLLYLKKFINKKQLNNLIKSYPNSTYKSMLLRDFK